MHLYINFIAYDDIKSFMKVCEISNSINVILLCNLYSNIIYWYNELLNVSYTFNFETYEVKLSNNLPTLPYSVVQPFFLCFIYFLLHFYAINIKKNTSTSVNPSR